MIMSKITENNTEWVSAQNIGELAEKFGTRLKGGGAHQSKTMMLKELENLLALETTDDLGVRKLIIEENILGKSTEKTRLLTFRHLNSLYGIEAMPPISKALFALWPLEPEARPLLALLCALARDPLLRDSASAIFEAPVGEPVKWPKIAEVFDTIHPGRFSEKMLRSLSQNCASTWTQSEHLVGSMKKLRARISPTPNVAAFAALIAANCGFGGPVLLTSPWLRILDVSAERAIDLLRQAEARGLARVRSAGDVTEISVRKPMATMLGVEDLA